MLENYLLEELVAFAQTGTLAQTAKQLNVTQPTVTRGMQKLEADLGVQLFNRQPNHITLTATGQFAAQQAAQVLRINQQLVTDIQNDAQRRQHTQIGTTIPGPLIFLQQLQSPSTRVTTDLQPTNEVEDLLIHRNFSIILSSQNLKTAQIDSRYLGTEQLFINLDQFMYHANQPAITFRELAGVSFIVMDNIGPWRATIQKEIPDATFMYQSQREAMAELTKYSNFPYFSSNLSPLDPNHPIPLNSHDRVRLPITNASAHMRVYASFLVREQTRLAPTIQSLQNSWPSDLSPR